MSPAKATILTERRVLNRVLAAEELEVLVLVDDRACAPSLIPLHGLALWLIVKFTDGRRVSVLLDGGPLLQALVDNALELSIQLESCDLALLTLWHFHHANAVLVARRMGILRAPLAAPYLPGSGRRLRGALYSEVEDWGVRRIELGGWWREVCYVIKLASYIFGFIAYIAIPAIFSLILVTITISILIILRTNHRIRNSLL